MEGPGEQPRQPETCRARAQGPWHFQRALWPEVSKHSQPTGSVGQEIHPEVVPGASSQESPQFPRGPEGREGPDGLGRGSSREGGGREKGKDFRATPRQPERSPEWDRPCGL